MKKLGLNINTISLLAIMLLLSKFSVAQKNVPSDSMATASVDTTVNITLKDVTVFQFRNPDDEREYLLSLSRIRKVLPYVKMAKQLYVDVSDKKENEKKKEYKSLQKGP